MKWQWYFRSFFIRRVKIYKVSHRGFQLLDLAFSEKRGSTMWEDQDPR